MSSKTDNNSKSHRVLFDQSRAKNSRGMQRKKTKREHENSPNIKSTSSKSSSKYLQESQIKISPTRVLEKLSLDSSMKYLSVVKFGPSPSGRDLSDLVLINDASFECFLAQLIVSAELSCVSISLVVENPVITVYCEGKALVDFLGSGKKEELMLDAVTHLRKLLLQTCPLVERMENVVDVQAALDTREIKVKARHLVERGDCPVGDDNKGHSLLCRMGWKTGSGLGRRRQGRLHPVVAVNEVFRQDRAGLGYRGPANKGSVRMQDVQVLILNHLQQDTIQDLVFGPRLSKYEYKLIRLVAKQLLMVTEWVKVGKEEFTVVSSSKVRLKFVVEELWRKEAGSQVYVGGVSYRNTNLPPHIGRDGYRNIISSLQGLRFQHLRTQEKRPQEFLKKQNKKVKVKQIVGDKCYRRVEYLYQTKDELVRNTRVREKLEGEKTRQNFGEYLYTNWKSGHEEYMRINGQKEFARNNGHEKYIRREGKINEKTIQLPRQEGEIEDINEIFGKMNISNETTSIVPGSLINCTLDGGTPYNMWMPRVSDKQDEVILKSLMFDRINTSETVTCKTPASDTNRTGGRTNIMERGYSRKKTSCDFTF